jgi:hypothetical protein
VRPSDCRDLDIVMGSAADAESAKTHSPLPDLIRQAARFAGGAGRLTWPLSRSANQPYRTNCLPA